MPGITITKYFISSLLTKPGFGQLTLMLLVASTIGNVFSYLYLLAASRYLGTESFGMFGSLFGIFYVFCLVGDASRITIANRVASLKSLSGELNAVKSVLKSVLLLVVIEFAVILFIAINSRNIASFFQMSNNAPVFFLTASLLTTVVLSVVLGLLQGMQLFGWLAASGYLVPQIFKLLSALLFVFFGWGLSGIIGALCVSNLLAIVIGILPLTRRLCHTHQTNTCNKGNNALYLLLPLALIGVIISVPTSIDVMLVTHYFNAYNAGIYNAAATMGKVILFAPIAVSLVMLPLVSKRHSQRKSTINIIMLSLATSVVISGIIVLLYWIWGDFLIRLFFGSEYLAASSLIIWYGIAMMLFTANYLFAQYYLALSKYQWLVIALVVTLSEVIAVFIFHNSLLKITIVLVVGNLLLLALNFLFLSQRNNNKLNILPEAGIDERGI